jgi:hypothetical protein
MKIYIQLFLINICFNGFNFFSEEKPTNPVMVYLHNLLSINESNPIKDGLTPTVSPVYVFFIKHKAVQQHLLKIILDFAFYDNNQDELFADFAEYDNNKTVQDEKKIEKIIEKYPDIYKKLEKQLNYFSEASSDTLLETMVSQYYFSIYTQKYFFSQGLIMFVNKEEAHKIHNVIYNFEIYYPESKYLKFLKLLTIIAYYESLSPLLYQNNFDVIINILSLDNDLKVHKSFYNHHKFLLKTIVKATKLNQSKKEMYKSFLLINDGQVGVGYNLLNRQMEKYNYILNKPLRKFSIQRYFDYLQLRPNQISCLFVKDKDGLIARTLSNENLNNNTFYFQNNHKKNINVDCVLINGEKMGIMNGEDYKQLIPFKKIQQSVKKQIE